MRVTGRPLGLLTSDIGISPSTVGSAGLVACSPPLDTMALELVAAWFIASSCVGCAAAAPDGVVLVWGAASATVVGGTTPPSCDLPALAATGGGSTTPREASAGPPCARACWCTSHSQELLDLVSCTWRHPSHSCHHETWPWLATDLPNHTLYAHLDRSFNV